MSDFLSRMKSAASANKKTIVLPEGSDSRVVEAAGQILKEGLAQLVVLTEADESNLSELADAGAQVINVRSDERRGTYATKLAELRAKKGMTYEQAFELCGQVTYFATMMVHLGEADGLVSGACHSTADTLRPALQILKTAPGTKLVSSFMMLCVPNSSAGQDGTLLLSDIGLNEYPDAEALSEIALSSAQSWEAFMNCDARVAMLSYSTKGSASSEHVAKVAEATKLVNEKNPKLACDGELQLDAALVPSVAELKAKGSKVAGSANVLVFPNLDAGNIGYKLVQRLAGADAYGPLLQGIAKPVNDLSRGCSAEDIVGVVAITAVQAQMAENK